MSCSSRGTSTDYQLYVAIGCSGMAARGSAGTESSQSLSLELNTWKNDDSLCLSRSNTSESLQSLASTVSTTSSLARSKNYFCDYEGCNKAFSRPSLLTEHQQAVHQGRKPFKCELCDRSFAKKSHLERHLHAHAEDKPLHCSFCQKGFTTAQQLKRHEITHTKSFKCPYEGCQECFYKHPQLRSHIMAIHEKNLSCKVCGKEFQRPYRLRNHMAKHHNPEVQNPYQCSHGSCASCFKTWSQLQAHIKNDHPKLRCPICAKPCVGESGLRMHMNVHDENLVKRNWKCDICSDVLFAKKSLMLEHYADKHTEEFAEIQRRLDNQAGGREFLQDDGEVFENPFRQSKKRRLNEIKLVRSEMMLENYLSEGKGAVDLLLNTVGRKLRCTFDKCYRTFKTEERLKKHIDRHKIHELKLKVLQEKTSLEENRTSARNDETDVQKDNVGGGTQSETDTTASASEPVALI
ncbi:hypothetical protein HG536_0F00320 [Torulaspora globosa]|uniref:Transcription factor IIIA n=1 Tax=Torulaspora globosa TaxID=48254 RepID=A0A7G3ZJM2_9SACH|nr:uncharacterized protein HG536_0F00320 [Torulaspora globosa]QLL33708.1 hypothetical protein HG536_0F00320 [Torulaspora globosa]